jgi:hypothetical protein
MSNVSMSVNNNTLLPGQWPFYVTMNVSGPYTSASFQVLVSADELETPIVANVYVFVKDPEPRLSFSTTQLYLDAVRGQQEVVDIVVSNNGGADTGPLSVRIAENAAIRLSSSAVIVNIPTGNSSVVSFSVSPSNAVPLGQISGTIVFSNSLVRSTISYRVNVISTDVGNLTVSVAFVIICISALIPICNIRSFAKTSSPTLLRMPLPWRMSGSASRPVMGESILF